MKSFRPSGITATLLRLVALSSIAVNDVHARHHDPPLALTKNGTYQGSYLPSWDQDVFLGMPYAQPPVGSLRWKWPQSINQSFDGVRDATKYGFSCPQYGTNFSLSEDCLTINVVRPANTASNSSSSRYGHGREKEKLPVLVWIYGGGLLAGSTADPQYNLSGIVKVGQDLDQPVIAVSMNYRLGIWGFMQSPQIVAEGSSNAGLVDQRLALQWIQENIEAFGGDPDKVTIWGESAGAQSIAYQMFAYGGRDDGLFRGAILESGGPQGCQVETLSWYNIANQNLAKAVGCDTAKDQLACLRGVSQETLYANKQNIVWNPLLDGDLLQGYPSQLIDEGKYVKIPIITGANTDETFAVATATGALIDTDQQLFNALLYYRSYALTPPTIRKLLDLYPNDPCNAPPYAITNCTIPTSKGLQWRRAAQIGSDMVMISGRRKMAELLTRAGQSVWSYRFDQRPWNGAEWDGVKHFQNVAFSFQNISGLLGPSPAYDSHARLARGIGLAYLRFTSHLDPNGNGGSGSRARRGEILPAWPVYSNEAPKNIVLNATESWVEDDTWRREGIEYINSAEVSKELLG